MLNLTAMGERRSHRACKSPAWQRGASAAGEARCPLRAERAGGGLRPGLGALQPGAAPHGGGTPAAQPVCP